VQACFEEQVLQTWCSDAVLQLATQLAQAAQSQAASVASNRSSGGSSGGGDSSSVTSSSSSSGRWSLAASLAVATAAGGYTNHLAAAHANSDTSEAETVAAASSSTGAADKPHTSPTDTCQSQTSCTSGGDGGGCGSAAAQATVADAADFECCSVCLHVMRLFIALRCLEHGTPVPAASSAAALAAAARRHCTNPHDHLELQLWELAWRHPVPGVCGNVLCGTLEGPSAVGVVRGPKGTLCGGCRAAWYCCEECQDEAWEAHRVVCGQGHSAC
jgi:hypothetical protein